MQNWFFFFLGCLFSFGIRFMWVEFHIYCFLIIPQFMLCFSYRVTLFFLGVDWRLICYYFKILLMVNMWTSIKLKIIWFWRFSYMYPQVKTVFNMGFYLTSYYQFCIQRHKTIMNFVLELTPSTTLNSQDDSRDRIDLHTKGRVCSIPSSSKTSCFFLCFHPTPIK